MQFKLENFKLTYGNATVFGNMTDYVNIDTVVEGGVFVAFESDEPFFEKIFTIGSMPEMDHFELCFRTETSCWMEPRVGSKVAEMPQEIQYLMVKSGALYLAFYALIDGNFRSCFEGSDDGSLKLLVQSGDTQTTTEKVLGFYVGAGSNPYQVVEKAAKHIQTRLGTFRLRLEKDVPEFSKFIGWCTYNAFYDQFTDEKLTSVLRRFKENHFQPGFLLLDDGWQTRSLEERNMVSFEEDQVKFPDGLKGFIDRAKAEFGVRDVITWHAFCGWWAGIKKENFPQYGSYQPQIHMLDRYQQQMIPDVLNAATVGKSFYPEFMTEYPVGLPEDMIGFYDDFYAYLKAQGVDGTKLDAMTWVEILGQATGGRVAMMKKLNLSLESAAAKHFNKQLINCSSCSNDMVFQSMDTNIIRSSCDYFPERPETHGKHIFINAHTNLWLGEFLLPDWDMFQSGNTAGDFHAAARAISGGPVYVTDAFQMENFNILKKLCYEDGRIPMCNTYAKVCEDSLFQGIDQKEHAIKVFNLNRYGGVIGAFNCVYDAENHPSVKVIMKPSDIDGLVGDNFAIYGHQSRKLDCVNIGDSVEVELDEFDFEIFTVVPVIDDFAPIGLVEKYNSGGSVEAVDWGVTHVDVHLGEAGDFVAFCDRPIVSVSGEGNIVAYHLVDGILRIDNAPEEFTVQFQ